MDCREIAPFWQELRESLPGNASRPMEHQTLSSPYQEETRRELIPPDAQFKPGNIFTAYAFLYDPAVRLPLLINIQLVPDKEK